MLARTEAKVAALAQEIGGRGYAADARDPDSLTAALGRVADELGPIDTLLVETGMGYGPYGVVGIGEDVATVVPTLLGPAVHNAIGVWIDDYPITPDKVLEALGKVERREVSEKR